MSCEHSIDVFETLKGIFQKLNKLENEELWMSISKMLDKMKPEDFVILANCYNEFCSEHSNFFCGMFYYLPFHQTKLLIENLKLSNYSYYLSFVNHRGQFLDEILERARLLLKLEEQDWRNLQELVNDFEKETQEATKCAHIRIWQESQFHLPLEEPDIFIENPEIYPELSKNQTDILFWDGDEYPLEEIMGEDNMEALRRYGPVNRKQDCCLSEDKCSKFCGCRMFTCDEFLHYLSDDFLEEQKQFWFSGSCDFCCRKIPEERWAIRQPLEKGGWRGCFCSFECLEKGATRKYPEFNSRCQTLKRILKHFRVYRKFEKDFDIQEEDVLEKRSKIFDFFWKNK